MHHVVLLLLLHYYKKLIVIKLLQSDYDEQIDRCETWVEYVPIRAQVQAVEIIYDPGCIRLTEILFKTQAWCLM